MAAFRLAKEIGADALEFDVKLSRDNVPVIHHDFTLDRTTSGSGKIKDFTLTELKRLDAGSKFDPFFAGESIPTLVELLNEFQDRILLNIELTNYNTPWDSLPELVNSMLKAARLSESILISSFNPLALRRIRILNPAIRTALLVGDRTPGWLRWLLIQFTPHDDLHPQYRLINEKMIGDCQRSNSRVNAWTVNQQHEMVKLLRLGVKGIISDDVEAAVRSREEVLSV
jgi:glycerophosphoryl diester phosphodiesterase